MKFASIIQAVIILLVMATAASCATGKEYADRVFTKRPATIKDSTQIRFLEKDSISFTDDGSYITVQKETQSSDTAAASAPTPAPEVITRKPGPVNGNPERSSRKRE